MARRNQMLELLGAQEPVGAGAGPVGTDALGTPELEGVAPRQGAEGLGEEATKNAIMQAMASPENGQPGMGGGGEPQLTPEEEEMIRAQLALAARQRLLGGGGV